MRHSLHAAAAAAASECFACSDHLLSAKFIQADFSERIIKQFKLQLLPFTQENSDGPVCYYSVFGRSVSGLRSETESSLPITSDGWVGLSLSGLRSETGTSLLQENRNKTENLG